MKLHINILYQSPIALKGLELLLDVTFSIAPAKHEVLDRLKEQIDTRKSIESQQKNEDPKHDTEDLQKDPPEVIFEDCYFTLIV